MVRYLRDHTGTLPGHYRYAPPTRFIGYSGTYDQHGRKHNVKPISETRQVRRMAEDVPPAGISLSKQRKIIRAARRWYAKTGA